ERPPLLELNAARDQEADREEEDAHPPERSGGHELGEQPQDNQREGEGTYDRAERDRMEEGGQPGEFRRRGRDLQELDGAHGRRGGAGGSGIRRRSSRRPVELGEDHSAGRTRL